MGECSTSAIFIYDLYFYKTFKYTMSLNNSFESSLIYRKYVLRNICWVFFTMLEIKMLIMHILCFVILVIE